MNLEASEAVAAADRSRLAAMVAGDLVVLAGLLADELIYTHGSGRSDDKSSYLAALARGDVRYIDATTRDLVVHCDGTTAWLHGRLTMTLERDGSIRRPDLRTLSVWRRDTRGQWKMAASVGTPIKP